MKTVTLFAILALTLPLYSVAPSEAYSSAESKFAQLEANSRQPQPSPEPTTISDAELNAYVNEGGVELPQGVERVNFSSTPGVVTGTARIDFEKVTAGRQARSMWMMLFTGIHDVKVVANAKGEGNTGEVHVQSMELDGVDVPRPALEFLVDRYIKPKYGNSIGLDSRFKLPARIDRATVGKAQVTLEQK
jgi:hypothetical protein